jgi:ABC-2 type transport system permease protein
MTAVLDEVDTRQRLRARPARALTAMLARELRVLRRNIFGFVVTTGTQPLLAAFVFLFVLPKIGTLGDLSGATGQNLASVLVPGMVANAALFSGMTAVSMSLVRELSFGKAIEDRMLAPMSLRLLGLQKIAWGGLNGVFAGLVVFPIVYFVHAPAMAPHIHVSNWPLFITCLVFIPLLAASLGLLLGTVLEVTQVNVLISAVLVPATMLGCVYFPWAALSPVPWLKFGVLINPVVYASEALRAVFTPGVPHMPVPAFLSFLVGGTFVVGWLAVRSFQRRLRG